MASLSAVQYCTQLFDENFLFFASFQQELNERWKKKTDFFSLSMYRQQKQQQQKTFSFI